MPALSQTTDNNVMKAKFILYLLILILISCNCTAQHCAWDYSSIVVIKIKAHERDSACIPGLKITVLDSLSKPVMGSHWDGSKYVDDTLRLYQNPPTTTQRGSIDNANPLNPAAIRFWFAGNNYILVTHFDFLHPQKLKLLIEDTTIRNSYRLKTTVVELTADDFYHLCNHYSNWDQGPQGGFINGFKPKEITLRGNQ